MPIRRADRWSLVGLGVVLAIGLATSLGFLNAAWRTHRAYDEYVERARVADLVINPSYATTDMDRAIRQFDGVESVHRDALLLTAILPPGTTVEEADALLTPELLDAQAWVQVRGSTDGRYAEQDVPIVERGRLAEGPHEVFLTPGILPIVEEATGHPVQVGDELTLGFAWPDAEGGYHPYAVEPVTVAGIGLLPDEVLPDDLYPRERALVSPDIAQRHTCVPEIEPGMSADQINAELFHVDCATAYLYYSLRLRDGTAGAPSIVDQFETAASELGSRFEPLGAAETGFFLIAADRSIEDRKIDRAIQPTVTSLVLFGAVAGIAVLAMCGLALVRLCRRHESTLDVERTMGSTRSGRTSTVLIAVAPALASGLVGAVVIALVTSAAGPVGVARSVDQSPGLSLAWWLAASVVLIAGVTLMSTVAIASWTLRLGSRRSTAQRAPRAWWAVRSNHPPRDVGIAAALGGSGRSSAVLTVAACVLAVTTMVTAIVFGTNLDDLASRPTEYGWNWDAVVVTGSGYGDLAVDAVRSDLDDRDDVEAWGGASVDSGAVIDGQAVPAVIGEPEFTDIAPAAIEGRLPNGPDEIALGRLTADELGLEVGDTTTVTSDLLGEPREVEVVGMAIMAPFGQFVADRAGLGVGAYLEDAELDPDRLAVAAIRTSPGRSGSQLIESLGDHVRTWDGLGANPLVKTKPVRPPEVVDVGGLARLPLALGAAVGLATLGGLTLMILLSVRDRRRDLSMLHVLGLTDRQVRTTVRWQVVTTLLIGLAVGIPTGWIVGRWSWLRFVEGLGARATVTFPTVWIAVTVAVTLASAMLIAAIPARRATTSISALELRPA
ncbi:MAG: ABC transporter permease [Acidimicrobiales bacterium]